MLIVLKSGSFNLLEPSGPVQACFGIALPLPYRKYLLCWGMYPYGWVKIDKMLKTLKTLMFLLHEHITCGMQAWLCQLFRWHWTCYLLRQKPAWKFVLYFLVFYHYSAVGIHATSKWSVIWPWLIIQNKWNLWKLENIASVRRLHFMKICSQIREDQTVT